MAALLVTAAGSTAQSTSKIYGYVTYGGTAVNGAVVTLGGQGSGQVTTADNAGHAGYYEFNLGAGNYVVTATYNGHSAWHAYTLAGNDAQLNLDISSATPTPTPGPSPTPTPRPSHEPGGLVYRNDSSSFLPMAVDYTVTPMPKPTIVLTPTPTIVPTPTPTPTPAPGLLSNGYVLLVIAIIAILVIVAAALAIIYLRK